MRITILLLAASLWGCQATTQSDFIMPVVVQNAPQNTSKKSAIIVSKRPRFILENMMNLAPDTIRNILGKPSLIRTDKDVRVWLYINHECTLHLYFYRNDNGDFRLDYVDTAGIGLSLRNPTVSPNGCLDSLVNH